MSKLRLFGLDLDIAGTTVRPPTGQYMSVLRWSTNLTPAEIDSYDLEIDAHIIWKNKATISVRLTIRYLRKGDRYLVSAEQPKQNNRARFGYWNRVLDKFPSGGILQLESGIVRIRLNDFHNRLNGIREDLSISFFNARTFSISSAKLPLSTITGNGSIGFDLKAGRLIAYPSMFTCKTFALRRIRRGNRIVPQPFFKRSHDSVLQSFALEIGFTDPILSFVPCTQKYGEISFVPLNTDFISRNAGGFYSNVNPVVAPLGLADYKLNLSLTQTNDKPVLKRIFVTPRKSTGAILKTFALAQRRTNLPCTLQFDGEMDLAVRLDSWHMPSTLMVAPIYGSGRTDDFGPFIVERTGDIAFHGIVPDAVFFSKPPCHLVCSAATTGAHVVPEIDGIVQNIVFDVTLPSLVITTWPEIHYPRPGHIYTKDSIEQFSNSAVDNWRFLASSAFAELILPLLPLSMVEAAGLEPGGIAEQYLMDANQRTVAGFSHKIENVQHKTFMIETPFDGDPDKTIKLSELYIAEAVSEDLAELRSTRISVVNSFETAFPLSCDNIRRNTIKVKEHLISHDYGPIKLSHRIIQGSPPDYFILRKIDDFDKFDEFPTIQDPTSILVPGLKQLKIGSEPQPEVHPSVTRPLGILKLSSNYNLNEIFFKENISTNMPDLICKNFLTDIIANPIKASGWTGLILFNMDLDLSDFPILQTIVGDNALKIRYLAIAAEKSIGIKADRAFSYYGRVCWSNPEPPEAPLPPGNAEEQRTFESTFTAREVDIEWTDNQLTRFYVESDIEFRSAVGIGNQERANGKKIILKIVGSYDKKEDKFRFLGKTAKKIAIISKENENDDAIGPIKQIYIKKAEIVRSRGRTVIELDGEVDCRPIKFGGKNWIDYPSGDTRSISFRGLGLEFPVDALGGELPQWLKFNYPSFKLDPNIPQFNLFGLEWLQMKIQNIGVDVGNKFNWGSLVEIDKVGAFDYGALITDIRLRFGKLPDLIAKKLKELSFDFSIGVGFDGNELPHIDNMRLRIALKAVGFEKLHLELMRFLVLKAEKLQFGMKEFGGHNVGKLDLVNLSIKILEKQIIDGLTMHMYGTPEGKKAILAYYGPGDSVFQNGFLDIYWLLVGRNLMLPDQLVKDVLSIDTKTNDEDHKKVAAAINKAVEDDSILPIGQAGGRTEVGEWLFGAGFGFFEGFFIGKFLFQDRAYYGIAMRGAFLKEWFGYDLAISVVYFKRARPEEDSFFIQVRVPQVDFSTFRFTGGVIAIEVFVSGGFLLDVGFPWIDQFGSRRWDRTFGAFITPFQGSGGFYLGYRKSTVIIDPRTGIETKLVQAVGGYAIQGGIGASFNGGIFRVWVRAGYYYILEGGLVLHDKNIRGLRLVGAVGILVEGAGELNWWIISVRVGVLASAEARVTLIWGMDPDMPRFEDLSSDDVILYLDFVLHARASARACIGSGPFKICKGVSVSVTMPFRTQIRLK